MNKKNLAYRSIKYIVRIGVRIVRLVFPPFDVFCIKYLAKKNGNTIQQLIPKSFREYCNVNGGNITSVEKEQERIVYEPEYYPEGTEKEYLFTAHDIYVAELTDVDVHGGSGIVIAGKYALTDIVSNDTENRVRYTSGTIRRGDSHTFYLEVSPNTEIVETAISLCGLAASNYYHLTFEILSRYGYVSKAYGSEGVTVLLDEQARMFPQYVELIHTIVGNANIRYVPLYSKVRCRKLIYPSMNTWMPMNVRRKNDFRISDNLLAESAVTNIRKATEGIRLEKTDTKVFISRKNASLSRVINEEDVAKLFEKAGYRIICTEELTYKEQVELFSSATCVVGATGAALTNFVYCNPGAIVGCIIPRKYEFCIYSTIAHLVGCKCLFFDAKIARRGRAISTDRYKVNLTACQGYIEELEKRIG